MRALRDARGPAETGCVRSCGLAKRRVGGQSSVHYCAFRTNPLILGIKTKAKHMNFNEVIMASGDETSPMPGEMA
ncbi:hypothetical protein [uncultured Tateyamaria sp.]|uniref:hypothetical protein n=1 Tax=uncultured Tateyamaria sp. TaxID=455651 RepID=UPI00262A640C|nr:hypothetical protein [uncultured Tateyamaria sp.]